MPYFDPQSAQLSAIEQIETVLMDSGLGWWQQKRLAIKYWSLMEGSFGRQILSLVTPEDKRLKRPHQLWFSLVRIFG